MHSYSSYAQTRGKRNLTSHFIHRNSWGGQKILGAGEKSSAGMCQYSFSGALTKTRGLHNFENVPTNMRKLFLSKKEVAKKQNCQPASNKLMWLLLLLSRRATKLLTKQNVVWKTIQSFNCRLRDVENFQTGLSEASYFDSLKKKVCNSHKVTDLEKSYF